jgi:hypothetical protein
MMSAPVKMGHDCQQIMNARLLRGFLSKRFYQTSARCRDRFDVRIQVTSSDNEIECAGSCGRSARAVSSEFDESKAGA